MLRVAAALPVAEWGRMRACGAVGWGVAACACWPGQWIRGVMACVRVVCGGCRCDPGVAEARSGLAGVPRAR